MSAWIVSKQHINTMVYFAIENDLLGDRSPDEFGQMLWQENHLSIQARYGDTKDAPEYTYTEPVKKPTPVAHSTNMECYDYQTCEHDDYLDSEAFTFVTKAKEILPDSCTLSGNVNYDIPAHEREVVWGWDFE